MSNSLPKGCLAILFVWMFHFGYSQLPGYDYYLNITVDATQVSGSSAHTDFPVLVDITDPALKSSAYGGNVQNSSGYDIAFALNGANTALNYEVEDYDAANGRIRAWVKLPTLSATTNTTFQMYFGKSGVQSNPSTSQTWSNDFVSVWHLNNNNLNDAKGNNNGTNWSTSNTTGKVADGRKFNDDYDKIKFGKFSVSGNQLTISSWFKVSYFDINDGRIISKSNGTANSDHYFMLSTIDNNGKRLRFRLKTNGYTTELKANSGSTISTGTWYYATAVYDGSYMKLYMNGQLVGVKSKSGNMSTNSGVWVAMGNHAYYGKHFSGRIDETRIATKARSSDWIKTEFNNQNSPSSFYTLGQVTSTTVVNPPLSYSDTCTVVIQAAQVAGNLSNFPVYLDLNSDQLKSTTYGGKMQSAQGYDIQFTDASYSNLDFQIESYDQISGNLKAWVKVPSLSSTNNTTLHLLYGSPGVSSNPGSTSVWDNNYEGVWHFDGGLQDATGNHNNGYNYGSSSASGKLGAGRSFDGSNDYIKVANSNSLNITGKKITLQAWVKAPVPNGEDSPFLHKGSSVNHEQYMLGIDGGASNNNINTRVTTSNGHYRHDSGKLNHSTWSLVTFVYNGYESSAQKKVYVNGVQVASHSAYGTINSTSAPLQIGKRADSRYFEGSLDELRISSTARSAQWIATEFNNQNDPSNFYTFSCGTPNPNPGGGSNCGQKITVVGKGSKGFTSVTLSIPDLSTVDSIRVESVFKGSKPSSVKFTSSSQNITDYSADYAMYGGSDKGTYSAVLNPASSITITPANNKYNVHSAIAYVYRSSQSFTTTTQMDISKVYQYKSNTPKYIKTFNIAASSGTRTITVKVPLTELNNDSRKAQIKVSAGSVSKTVSVNTYDLGASLKILEVKLDNVPGNETQVSVEVDSPDSDGDSFVAGNILVDAPCEQSNPVAGNCMQKISVVGSGSKCKSSVTLNIPDLATVDSIRVESVYKGSKPSYVKFGSSQECIKDFTAEGVINGNSDKGYFHAVMAPASSITVTPYNNTGSVHAAVAYIYRSGQNFGSSSQIEVMKVYQYRTTTPTYTKNFTIPVSTSARTLTLTIPVAELNDDNRIAKITITAGSVTKTVTAYKENLGASLHMFRIDVPNVPGDVTSVSVSIDSPDSNGDSFIAGNIVLDVPCDNPNAPDAVNDYVHTAKDQAVDIHVLGNDTDPDDELDRSSVSTIGLAAPKNGVVVSVNTDNGVIQYLPGNGFIGVDSFQYQVCNLSGYCDIAWVFVKVSDCGPGYVKDSVSGNANAIVNYYINPNNSHNQYNMNNALGAPDNAPAYIHWGGDYLIADLGDTIPAGEFLEIRWRKRAGESGTAKMMIKTSLSSSTICNKPTYSQYPTTTNTSFTTVPVYLSEPVRYIMIYKNNDCSPTDFEIDAISYRISKGCLVDSDGDGVPNVIDIDDDDDGILDVVEAYNGDDPSADHDGDKIPNYMDSDYPGFVDVNGDGVNDHFDWDGDGTPDHLDTDSDNDAISDNIEGQTTNAYTIISMNDDDKDGLMNTYDQSTGAANSVGIVPNDHDEDGTPDFYDDDADDDGWADWIEAFDMNDDGNPYPELTALGYAFYEISGGLDYYSMTRDENGNGILDWMEACVSKAALPGFLDPNCYCYYDTDGDGIVDLLDPDNFGDPKLQSELPNGVDDKDFRDQHDDNGGGLPVELLTFEARVMDENVVELSWTTATELNNDYFTLHKGQSSQNLEWLSYVSGSGTTNELKRYVSYDYQANSGLNYYQLSQTDYNGSTEVVGLATVVIDSDLALEVLKGYMQNGQLQVEVRGVDDEPLNIELYSSTGSLVFQQVYNGVDGLQTFRLPVQNAENGIYLIRASNQAEASVLKIFIKL